MVIGRDGRRLTTVPMFRLTFIRSTRGMLPRRHARPPPGHAPRTPLTPPGHAPWHAPGTPPGHAKATGGMCPSRNRPARPQSATMPRHGGSIPGIGCPGGCKGSRRAVQACVVLASRQGHRFRVEALGRMQAPSRPFQPAPWTASHTNHGGHGPDARPLGCRAWRRITPAWRPSAHPGRRGSRPGSRGGDLDWHAARLRPFRLAVRRVGAPGRGEGERGQRRHALVVGVWQAWRIQMRLNGI